MVVQHDEIKKLLKGNNLDSTNEWIVYGTKGERGYWIALSDRGGYPVACCSARKSNRGNYPLR